MEFFETDWKKLLMMYFGVEISEEFINCAKVPLSEFFIKTTGLKMSPYNWINWQPEDGFNYRPALISRLGTNISFKYGKIPVFICWKSKSGRIYNISDMDIGCSDIEFWFEGLDPGLCHKLTNPKWTLFTFPEDFIQSFKKECWLDISFNFLDCAGKQLTPIFEKTTGIKVNKQMGMSTVDREHMNFFYEKNTISKLSVGIVIVHYWEPLTIVWKSNSGRIYGLTDTDIDCNDIEFWFEGLDPAKYHKYLYSDTRLPFKLKDLTYELEVKRLDMNLTISMVLKEDQIANSESIAQHINLFIEDFNQKSEKKNRKYGVVHNYSYEINSEKIIYEIDTGFSGPVFLKKLLVYFSQLNSFLKVIIE